MIQITCSVEQTYQVDKPHLELVHRTELNSDCLCALNDSLISTCQSLKDTFQITNGVYRDHSGVQRFYLLFMCEVSENKFKYQTFKNDLLFFLVPLGCCPEGSTC